MKLFRVTLTGADDSIQPEQIISLSEKYPCSEGLVWIDAETRVRSDDDQIFDLEKVEQFLKNAAPYVEA